MNRAIFLPRARRDLDEIGLYIAVDSVDAALRFVAAVEETCQLIVETPHIGRARGTTLHRRSGALSQIPPLLELLGTLALEKPFTWSTSVSTALVSSSKYC